MQNAGILSGGAPVIKKYKMSATGYVAGAMFLVSAAGASGNVSVSTTTSWADAIGLSQDAGAISVGVPLTYSTTQGDPEGLISIIINPDLILRALLVGSATDAVLTANPIVTASANGLTAVGTNSVSNHDEGTIWYISGANAGKSRKITSVSSATATVIVPFLANAVGDQFLSINTGPTKVGATMGTNLLNVRQDNVALGSDAEAGCIDVELNGVGNSYAQYVARDHAFASS